MLQQRLSKSGITNRSKWTWFSSQPQMSTVQFTRRLVNLGIPVSNQEIITLWKCLNISTSLIKFEDFVKFIETDPASLIAHVEREDPPPPPAAVQVEVPAPSKSSLIEIIDANRRGFLLKFMDADPAVRGFVSLPDFTKVCNWFQATDGIPELTARYTNRTTRLINYLTLLSDLSEGLLRPQTVLPDEIHVHIEPEIEVDQTPGPSTPPRRKRSHQTSSGLDPDLMDAACYGDSDSESPSPEGSPEAAEVVAEVPEVPDVVSRAGRRNLDPMIFATRPKSQIAHQPSRQRAEDIPGTQKLNNLTTLQLLDALPPLIFRTSKKLKECFQKWKGGHEFLTAADLRDGLALDINVLVPLEDLELLVRYFGGQMTLSNFIKMMSGSSQRMDMPTDDNAIVARIAELAKGDKWEDCIFNSTCVEDIVAGFATQGIELDAGDIGRVTSKLGRMGLITAIHAAIGA
jgi:Ca2+-binding EF-hand superfamily protein